MGKRFSKKLLAGLLCAVLVVVTAIVGVFMLARPESEPTVEVHAQDDVVAEYIDSDITHFNNWVNEPKFDTERYGNTAGNVYPRTTLWDIKTRIVAKANVNFTGEGGRTDTATDRVLKPNEFNISILVNGRTYNDRTEGADFQPFQTQDFQKESGGKAEGSFNVTIYVAREIESSHVENNPEVVVQLVQDPAYIYGTMQGTPPADPVYTTTQLQSHDIYSFDYRSSITAIPFGKTDEDRVEVPRELLTLQFSNGNAQFVSGSGTANNVTASLTYISGKPQDPNAQNDSCEIAGAIGGVLTAKAVRIKINQTKDNAETNTGDLLDGTVYNDDPDGKSGHWHRVIGVNVPVAQPGQEGTSVQYYGSTEEHKYYNFIICGMLVEQARHQHHAPQAHGQLPRPVAHGR